MFISFLPDSVGISDGARSPEHFLCVIYPVGVGAWAAGGPACIPSGVDADWNYLGVLAVGGESWVAAPRRALAPRATTLAYTTGRARGDFSLRYPADGVSTRPDWSEHFQLEWKRCNSCLLSDFISLGSLRDSRLERFHHDWKRSSLFSRAISSA
jgi:hypothetical protein